MAAHPVYVGLGEAGFLVTWPVCLPLNIDCAKLRNTGLNKLVVKWSFFHNLCRYLCDLVHVIETIFHLYSFSFLSNFKIDRLYKRVATYIAYSENKAKKFHDPKPCLY